MLLSDSLYFDQPLGLSLYQISNSGLKSNSGVKMYSEVSDCKTSVAVEVNPFTQPSTLSFTVSVTVS